MSAAVAQHPGRARAVARGGARALPATTVTVASHLRKPQDDRRYVANLVKTVDRLAALWVKGGGGWSDGQSARVTESSGSLRSDRQALYREPTGNLPGTEVEVDG